MNRRIFALACLFLFLIHSDYCPPPLPSARAEKAAPAKGDNAKPSLSVEQAHEHTFGNAGQARVWSLAGEQVREVTAYLLVVNDGQAERVSEIRCTWDAPSPSLVAQIAFWDQGGQALGAAGKRLPSLSLTFRAGAPDKKAESHTGKVILEPKGGRSSMNYDCANTYLAERTVLYNHHLHMKQMEPLEDGEIRSETVGGGTSEKELIQSSKQGRVIVAVVVEWKK